MGRAGSRGERRATSRAPAALYDVSERLLRVLVHVVDVLDAVALNSGRAQVVAPVHLERANGVEDAPHDAREAPARVEPFVLLVGTHLDQLPWLQIALRRTLDVTLEPKGLEDRLVESQVGVRGVGVTEWASSSRERVPPPKLAP